MTISYVMRAALLAVLGWVGLQVSGGLDLLRAVDRQVAVNNVKLDAVQKTVTEISSDVDELDDRVSEMERHH